MGLLEAASLLEMGWCPMVLAGQGVQVGRDCNTPPPPGLCWTKASLRSLPISKLGLGMTACGSPRCSAKGPGAQAWPGSEPQAEASVHSPRQEGLDVPSPAALTCRHLLLMSLP